VTKICGKCGNEKSIDKYYTDKNRKDKLQWCCKICSSNYAKTPSGKLSRRVHKSKKFSKYSQIEKQRKLLDRYGLTVERYLSYFDLQDDRCLNPNCKTILIPYTKQACIDHNHQTGEVRGLLCQACNVRLGWFENSRTWIESYLG
jgi:hypothetical protein